MCCLIMITIAACGLPMAKSASSDHYQLRQDCQLSLGLTGLLGFTMFHSLDVQKAECPDGQKSKRLEGWTSRDLSAQMADEGRLIERDERSLLSIITKHNTNKFKQ